MKDIGRKLIFQTISFTSLFLMATQLYAALIPPHQSAAPTRIRVRLTESAAKVAIRGFDLKLFQSASATQPTQAVSIPSGQGEWEFRCQDDRIRAIPVKGGAALTLKAPVMISSPAGLIRYQNRPYREEIKIHSMGSLCEVVNELDIEKYLNGLVNAEFSSRWSTEAVQAQVIAARTYAMYQIKQANEKAARTRQIARYDVDATVKDQVYDGYVSEDFKGARAVESTRGMVLVAQARTGRFEPIKAFYHASCAGMTQLPEDVWGSRFAGFKHRVNCPFCNNSSKVNWSLELTEREIAGQFFRGSQNDGAQPGWPRFWNQVLKDGKLLDVHAGPLDRALRPSKIISIWQWGQKVVELSVSPARFREWIGPSRLKSTSFDLTRLQTFQGPAFRVGGRGNGHGVGMCQLGAKFLGEKGYKTASILKHYYPDALLTKMW